MSPAVKVVLVRVCDVLVPGTGALLAGHAFRGAGALGAWVAILVSMPWAVCAGAIPPVNAAMAVGVAYLALEALLALSRADGRSRAMPVRAALGLAAAAAIVTVGIAWGVGSRCCLVTIQDMGEFPRLLPGEVVMARRVDPSTAAPARGELVVAHTSEGDTIARVAALPGDRLDISGPSLVLNEAVVQSRDLGDVKLTQEVGPLAVEARSLRAYLEEMGDRRYVFFFRRGVELLPTSHVVPAGHVFLLADNRSTEGARDSREVGPVPVEAIVGLPVEVLWSSGPGSPRWNRIGAAVDEAPTLDREAASR